MNTKCSVIEDMIPLYKEGLCSKDTAEMVREHIEECENCRKLCEELAEPHENKDTTVPDESKVFRKVNRKMKRSKLKIAILSVILLAVLGSLGLLTIGQITRADGLISFETLVQSVETYRIAKMVANGDMDEYADSISFGGNIDANLNIRINMEEIRDNNKQALNNAFNKYMKEKKVKRVTSFGTYGKNYFAGNYTENDCPINNTARITYEDGTEMLMELFKSYDGKYICGSAYTFDEDEKSDYNEFVDEMVKVINYVNIPKFSPDGLADVFFLKFNKEYIASHPEREYDHFLMANWFAKEYQEQVNKEMVSYYVDNGFCFDKFINSEIRYDKEKKMFYNDLMFEGCDGKGKAIMTAKVYSSPEGLIPPAKEDIQIVRDGCSDELVDALMNFLGTRS